MNFDFSDDQRLILESFARLFDTHSRISQVRAAASDGFDRALWRQLGAVDAFAMRVDAAHGGAGLGLVDACLVMREAGRTLASGPLAETIAAAPLLATCFEAGAPRFADVRSGRAVLTMALHDTAASPKQWVSGARVADLIIGLDGDRLVLFEPRGQADGDGKPARGTCIGRVDFTACTRLVETTDPAAVGAFVAALEAWKLLKAAELAGIAHEALRMAAAYACERIQFGQPIGAYQAVSHPLADCWLDVEAGWLVALRSIAAIATGEAHAAALLSAAYWLAARAARAATARALHTFGGYGLTTEYDIHLYHLRARAVPMVLGDPEMMAHEVAQRLWGERDSVALPLAGEPVIDFALGERAAALHAEVTAYFAALPADVRHRAHYSFSGHVPEVHRDLAERRLLFVNWPVELGGRAADIYADYAAMSAWHEAGWTRHAQGTSNIIGLLIHRFGSERLKREALTRIAAGEAVCSLGFSEPASGSDVFAAQTRAVRDGDDWVIDGQKMFTSGADVADYVLLLARTDPAAPKHRGITTFIVPLDAPGVMVQPVETFQDEPTTITFYADVRVPDAYRVGEIGGGMAVMASAFEIEHGGSTYLYAHHELFAAGVALARQCGEARAGSHIGQRLAAVFARLQACEAMVFRGLWSIANGRNLPAAGSASKLIASEGFRQDASALLHLFAPHTLNETDGAAAQICQASRHSEATTIYGGTSEIHRSVVAERALGLPRTR